MHRAALLLLLCLGATCSGAPLVDGVQQAASCADPVVLGAANEAMDKINKDRSEGYVYALLSLANAHTQRHGENSAVFYLTMNVQETNCSVVSKAHFKNCEARDFTATPVYGQCKAAIFISRVNRVTRLYKYNCVVRPVAAEMVSSTCPGCPTFISKDDEEITKTVTKAMEQFNKASGMSKYFKLLQVDRATAGYIMFKGMMYYAEFSIQETTCANPPQNPADCPFMDCEFSHKGFCKASYGKAPKNPSGDATEFVKVNCELYEPQAAEQEKRLHQTGTHTDQAHDHTHDGHSHLHEHEHHHQQLQHSPAPHKPEGLWRQIAPQGGPVTLPVFPDVPAGPPGGVTLQAKEDPEIQGQMEPSIGPFPTTRSPECPVPVLDEDSDFVAIQLSEDPVFMLPA